MDQLHFSSFMLFLKGVPDPRKARGQRYAWWFLLAVICIGIVGKQLSGRAIAHWSALHAEAIRDYLRIKLSRMPSESTVRRVLHHVDIKALERQVAAFSAQVDGEQFEGWCTMGRDGEVLRGQAVDGKEVRGASAHGVKTHLVSCVRHGSGIVLGQCKVDEKTNEIRAVPELLAELDLTGTVTTFDALLTQRHIAQQIIDQGGDYLMVVKRNQLTLYEDLETLFSAEGFSAEKGTDIYRYVNKGHGRLERRTLICSTLLNRFLDWPGIAQVMQRRCQRLLLKKQIPSDEVTYGITSVLPDRAGAKEMEAFWRGHWTVENVDHYVRDETLKEDRCQMRKGNAPQAFAALKNGLLTLLRAHGWNNIADALRYYGAFVCKALLLIGIC